MQTPSDFRAILLRLLEHECDFVLVGALSAVLQGAGITTFDVDIVHSRTDESIQNLLNALASMNAIYRGHPGALAPARAHLKSDGHQLLQTDFGPLDVLGTIEDGLDYEALVPLSALKEWKGKQLRILRVSEYMALKAKSNLAKDVARMPLLREVVAMEADASDDTK